MARTEDEALDELLNGERSLSWSRVTTWVASVVTLLVIVALLAVTMQQIAQTDRDAFDAHLREARVQRALDAAREVQAIGAEQFLSFGAPRGATKCQEGLEAEGCSAGFRRIVQDFVHGRFVDFNAVRELRAVAGAGGGDEQALAAVILDINSLERWVAPLAESAADLEGDELYRSVTARLPNDREAAWSRIRDRLDAVSLGVSGANEGSCEVCARMLWGDPGEVAAGAAPSFIDPADSFTLSVWQAECLRKLPILADPAYANCDMTAHSDDEHETAQAMGRVTAQERFEAATAWLEAQASSDGEKVCDVLEGGSGTGRRTVSVIAGRAYNGLAMSLINRDAVSSLHLKQASEAINRAICFREEAKETRAQVAASRENLAVIAYRRAWQKQVEGERDDASEAFGQARCLAEAAVADNANLPWSWTILYLTHTASSSVFADLDCAEAMGQPDSEVGNRSRTRARLWRKLTFFDPDAFAPEELPGLLRMFPEGEFNRTGYTNLAPLLVDVADDHRALRDGTEAPWKVFVTSVVEPAGIKLPGF
ncbi:MAG: hypothetical protein AAGA48_01140 [Myxococcota bacterium]